MRRILSRFGPFLLAIGIIFPGPFALGDGMVMAPREYKGSLEEQAQEAILIFHPGDGTKSATEDMILKIQVKGDTEKFAWIIPFPNEPNSAPEDPALFDQLHRYVQARLSRRPKAPIGAASEAKSAAPAPAAKVAPVEVLSRKVVGKFDVAVVRENKPDALLGWLDENGYRKPEAAEEILAWYRRKDYVFACVKVSDAAKSEGSAVALHPLRFSFETGGRDGIFFPMRLTGLQSEPFDVNLYVFYDKWINDRLSKFGYTHRGFSLVWRDFDGPDCKPNAGKAWSDPASDPFLKGYESTVPAVSALVRKLHPGALYYLTNIRATGLKAAEVRAWPDDLWLYPYYTDPKFVPYDARKGATGSILDPLGRPVTEPNEKPTFLKTMVMIVVAIVDLAVFVLAIRNFYRKGERELLREKLRTELEARESAA